jgi:L-ascorbate metabolism protein UlaG (beta-lactamase superfamily)
MRALLLLLTLTVAGHQATPAGRSTEATLVYVANMGVVLEGDGRRVAIDAFHHGALAMYAAVPAELLQPLEQAREPFARLDLMLTTHRHLDHFDAGSVAARLGSDSGVRYVAATETTDSLYARTGLRSGHPRVLGVRPPARGETPIPDAPVGLAVLDLPHNPTPSRRVANVGFLVQLGGLGILHVGDADPDAATFAAHRLAGRVDVAIVPFWYLTGADETVRQVIGARVWVASHIPPSDTAAVRRQVLARIPGAVVLTRPGERHQLR